MHVDQTHLPERVNGYMVWLRLILPALMAVGVFQLSALKQDVRDVKQDLTGEIKELRNTINSDVRKDLVDIKERLSSLETRSNMERQGKQGGGR